MILYPEFEKCTNLTLDNYWKQAFTSFSLGKFPKNIKYNKEKRVLYLRISKGNTFKWESFPLPKEERQFFEYVKTLLQTKLMMFSSQDTHCTNQKFESEATSWKQLKSKFEKDLLIHDFVFREKVRNDLTIDQAKQLLFLIYLGLQIKCISSEDIKIKKKIISIRGIVFNRSLKQYRLSNLTSVDIKLAKQQESNKFIQAVESYLMRYRKREIF